MKGVVLAGGTGSRLRPVTFSMAKQLIPIANKPVLFYGLEDLREAGIREVGIVVSPESSEPIRRAVGDGSSFDLNVTYIVQDKPLGLAHALMTALEFVAEDECVMYLGDNLVKQGIRDIVADFKDHRPNTQVLLSRVEDPSSFGVADVSQAGRVMRLLEKPSNPPSDLALVGVYLFDGSIGEAVRSIEPSARGELEITDAIQYLIDNGKDVRASVVRDWWKDTGRKADLLHANELVLADLQDHVEGQLFDCDVRGPVQVGAGSVLVDCQITGPAVIGDSVRMSRVQIGPNTSVGAHCHITDAAIENSIIMTNTDIASWNLQSSLVGNKVMLKRPAPPGFVEVTLGDLSHLSAE